MAKILVTIVIVLLVAIGLFVGCSTLLVKIVSDVTDTRTYEVDNTEVCVRGGKAYIRSFRWNGDMNNTDIYFPSTVNDTEKNKELTITGIGGIYGSGSPVQCHIEFTEDVPKDERDREKDIPTEHDQIILTVHVSPSIEDVLGLEGGRYFTYNEDGSRVSHDIYYFIECDENNEKLYSKDGKLYYRDGDMQESHIDYVPDEEEQQTENSSETIESVIASENIPINTETDSKADRFGSKVASEKPTEVVETTTAAEPEETSAETKEIEDVSDIDENVEKAYEEILSFYRDTLQNAGENTAVNEEKLKTPLLQFGANGMLDVNEVGWLYHDIDGNGTSELFITYYGVPRDVYVYNTVKDEAELALGCSDGENLDIYSNGLVCTSFDYYLNVHNKNVTPDNEDSIELSPKNKMTDDELMHEALMRFCSVYPSQDDTLLEVQNQGKITPPYTYSVKQYAEDLTARESDNTVLCDLVDAMLYFGTVSQDAFGHNTENPANDGKGYTGAEWNYNSTFEKPDLTNAGIEYYGSSLMLETKVSERHYFKVTGDIKDFTFTIDGKSVDPVQYEGDPYYWYIQSEQVKAEDLGRSFKIEVIKGTKTIISYYYSPMDYVSLIFVKYDTTNKWHRQAEALYWYWKAAEAYRTAYTSQA